MRNKLSHLVAHIEGASGSGKTTLLQVLQTKHPAAVFKDTDEFTAPAKERAGLSNTHHSVMTQAQHDQLLKTRQQVVIDFLEQHKDTPVVLGGSNIRTKFPSQLPNGEMATENKLLLSTGPLVSTLRRLKRNWKSPDEKIKDVPSRYLEAKKLHQIALDRGYTAMSTNDAEKRISDLLDKKKEAAKDAKPHWYARVIAGGALLGGVHGFARPHSAFSGGMEAGGERLGGRIAGGIVGATLGASVGAMPQIMHDALKEHQQARVKTASTYLQKLASITMPKLRNITYEMDDKERKEIKQYALAHGYRHDKQGILRKIPNSIIGGKKTSALQRFAMSRS